MTLIRRGEVQPLKGGKHEAPGDAGEGGFKVEEDADRLLEGEGGEPEGEVDVHDVLAHGPDLGEAAMEGGSSPPRGPRR